MDCKTELIPYADTGYFSSLVLDYLKEDTRLMPFYQYSPINPDFDEILEHRKKFPPDRQLLFNELQQQYKGLEISDKVAKNIQLLKDKNTFTICTAHQPNLFTGYLYFVYKILHAVKLSEYLKEKYPQYHFVPVYYMGSEDNDIEELGTVHIGDATYRWQTTQTGAVGRMKTDDLIPLIENITKSLGTAEYALEISGIIKEAYLNHPDIQSATAFLVNTLFGKYGLVTVIADTPGFKRAILPVMKDDIFNETPFKIVSGAIKEISKHYHPQAIPREINLFYLKNQLRERIVRKGAMWQALNTDIKFSRSELEIEMKSHPERFSPNVVLRGILQETILPNIVFIGGGGELSYWMELKELFGWFKVPFPLLMLRCSALWIDGKSSQRLKKVGLMTRDLFQQNELLINNFVEKHTQHQLVLKDEYEQIEKLYKELDKKAEGIDVTLRASASAEKKKSLISIGKLEHKFLRAEKKKFAWQTELILNVKKVLFPHHHLQERWENLLPFYATYGPGFIETVYHAIDPMNRKFTIISNELH
ncbi:MAG: bacillithiol biosynthesis cysteine-adding enzyme BshC [Chitinophagaceae bacterium]